MHVAWTQWKRTSALDHMPESPICPTLPDQMCLVWLKLSGKVFASYGCCEFICQIVTLLSHWQHSVACLLCMDWHDLCFHRQVTESSPQALWQEDTLSTLLPQRTVFTNFQIRWILNRAQQSEPHISQHIGRCFISMIKFVAFFYTLLHGYGTWCFYWDHIFIYLMHSLTIYKACNIALKVYIVSTLGTLYIL